MMNTNDLRKLKMNDRDTFILLAIFAKTANEKSSGHSRWSVGFRDGFAAAYKAMKAMKVGISPMTIGEKEKHLLDFNKYNRKISMLHFYQKRRAAKKAERRLAK